MKLNFLDCWQRRKDLPAFESGELPPERAEALAAHLAVCEHCRKEWETLAGVAEVLRATPPEPVVPALNLWSRIEADILEPAPATPSPAPRWRVAAVPVGAAVACAGVFAATSGLGLLTPEPAATPKVIAESAHTLEAAGPVVTVARVIATPEPTPEPIEVDPTPAPTPKTARPKMRRPAISPRKDPFAPTEKLKATPRPDYWSKDGEVVDDIPVIIAGPPSGEPEVNPVAKTSKEQEEPQEIIQVERPAPARTARRDAAADAEAAERRAAEALGSPLDAVARAAQPRKLFP
ncbi:MAG: zf-HC2 domain-containing protein [Armatimonas sp.]